MKKTMVIESRVDNLRLVEKEIDELIKGYALDTEDYGKILIGTVEAVNNAIVHGNKSDPAKLVTIQFYLADNKLQVQVQDEGPGFDYSNIPDPTAPENIENLHGRGIFLMRKLADKVEFRNEGALVEMNFNL